MRRRRLLLLLLLKLLYLSTLTIERVFERVYRESRLKQPATGIYNL
jgi:hypothetical protein